MPIVLITVILLVLAVGAAGYWLFRQRTPEEMRAAHELLRKRRKPRE